MSTPCAPRTAASPTRRSSTFATRAPGFARFGADTFVVVEKWASVEALQAHAVAPHMKAYAAKVREWTANRAIHVLEPA